MHGWENCLQTAQGENLMAEFLIYGQPDKVRNDLVTMIEPVVHWTCGEPNRIHSDDTTWITTVFSGRLLLIAPILVGGIISYEESRKRCGKPIDFFVPAEHMTDAYITRLKEWLNDGNTDENIHAAMRNESGMHLTSNGYEPFEKPHHIFAADKGKFAKFLDISSRAAQLRFVSSTGKDRLSVTNRRIDNPQQLRAMRELSDDSAMLLHKIWDEAEPGLREIPNAKSSRKTAKSPPSPKLPLKETDKEEVQRLNQQFPKATPEDKQRMVKTVERGGFGEVMKEHRGHKCQICEAMGLDPVGFMTKRGIPYTEAHHVEEIGKGGELGATNIVVLCANHHRQMHSGNVTLECKTAGEFIFCIDKKRVTVRRYSP